MPYGSRGYKSHTMCACTLYPSPRPKPRSDTRYFAGRGGGGGGHKSKDKSKQLASFMPRSCPCPPSTGDAATCDVFETGRLSTLLSSVDPGDGADVGKPPKPLLIASPTGEGEYPVLILLHGYLLSNSFYSQLLQHIASHGFILVAPQVLIPVSVSCSDPSPTLLLPGNFNSCTRWPDRTQPKRSNPQRQSQIGCREAFQPFFPRKSPPLWLSWLSPATAGEARQPSPWP